MNYTENFLYNEIMGPYEDAGALLKLLFWIADNYIYLLIGVSIAIIAGIVFYKLIKAIKQII